MCFMLELSIISMPLSAADVTHHPWEDLSIECCWKYSAFKSPSAKLLVDLNSLKAEFG